MEDNYLWCTPPFSWVCFWWGWKDLYTKPHLFLWLCSQQSPTVWKTAKWMDCHKTNAPSYINSLKSTVTPKTPLCSLIRGKKAKALAVTWHSGLETATVRAQAEQVMTAPTQSDVLKCNTSSPYHVSPTPATGHCCPSAAHLSDEVTD